MPSSISTLRPGRRAFVVDGQRAAPVADRAVVDDGNARRRDPLADAAGEGRRALAVEVAFEPVADRLVQQDAGPAGAEHHLHFAGRRGDGLEVDQRLCERDVDGPVPLGVSNRSVVEIAAAEPVIAGLAPSPSCSATIWTLSRTSGRTSCATKPSARTMSITLQLAASETATWATRGSRARAAASICWHSATLSRERDRRQRVVGAVHRLVGARGGGAGAPLAGSSSFSVAAARSIAASLISLAWAKAVVSPDHAAQAKARRGVDSRRSSAARHRTRTPRWPNIGGRARRRRKTQDAWPQAACAVGIEGAVQESPRIGSAHAGLSAGPPSRTKRRSQ